jgi:hypothetical protein
VLFARFKEVRLSPEYIPSFFYLPPDKDRTNCLRASKKLRWRKHMSSPKKKYPYSKNRVFLSTAIALLSLLLAAMIFQSYQASAFYYILYLAVSTLVFTIATLEIKKRLYPLVVDSSSIEDESDTGLVTWKRLLLVFGILIAAIAVPLLLAGVLGGAAWFILMISFILGVSLSEIIFYLNTR